MIEPEAIIERLRDFSPVQRIILATAGTLQTTLSAYFAELVHVELREQHLAGLDIMRRVDLVCQPSGRIACRAETLIGVVDDEVRERILRGQLGLGQILESLGRRPRFVFEDVESTPETFARAYRLEGTGYTFRIREVFPAGLYPAAPS